MTRQRLTRWATGAACAAALAAPLAAQAQMYPQPLYPQQVLPQQALPMYPQPMPPREHVFFYEGTPVMSPGDEPGHWDARQNVIESNRYEALARSNPGFRARRMAQECGAIGDPAGQSECLSTFDYGER